MYLVNTELTLNWYLLTGAAPPLLANLDIRITRPDGTTAYNNAAIAVEDYVLSTETTKGAVSYKFTPDTVGLWTISLSEGSSSASRDFYTHKVIVSKNDTYIKKAVKGSLL